ncbi:phenylacetate--CoA ligase family protein [Nocardioides terrisoli]|uniref:phenylacetate--CoA ligase family protein n=1 Tax=Nocardioides terrisoli TaxID=3388267 RepID=UPI00287B6F9A|nr:phenylacetate--CoA ligase family protein [Nocardioides marmorisolisilvae]
MTVTPKSAHSETDEFWDRKRETRDPREREALVLERLQRQLHRAYAGVPFYRRRYDVAGFHPSQVKTLADFTARVPVVTKKELVADQQEHPPFGSYAAVPREALMRVHGSSGTSGVPTLYGISAADWLRSEEVCRMALWSAGVRPRHLVQISFPFGLFIGGWGLLQACECLGAAAFPVGSLMPTDQQIDHIVKLGVDVLVATPSYAMHLGRRAVERGIDLGAAGLRTVIVAGEPGGSISEIRKSMTTSLGGAFVVDLGAGASSEMHPFYANVGCTHAEGGVHLIQDENYTEVVDRDDPHISVPVGERGGLVATHLWRESQPMIRFWLGDESYLSDELCACGRTFPRLPEGVIGRLDDMLLIRGANVYPSAIEAIVNSHPDTGSEFRIIVDRASELDELTVEVEADVDPAAQEARAIAATLAADLKARLMVRARVEVVAPGTFEPQVFKARRVVDRRGRT